MSAPAPARRDHEHAAALQRLGAVRRNGQAWSEAGTPAATIGPPRTVTAHELLAVAPPALDYVIPGFLVGTVGLLSGADGTGKSWLRDAIAWAVASGGRINPGIGGELVPRSMVDPDERAPGPLPLLPGRVVIVAGEDPLQIIAHRTHRMAQILRRRGAERELVDDIADQLSFAPWDAAGVLWSASTADGAGGPTTLGHELDHRIVDSRKDPRPLRLIILDTLAALADLEELSQQELNSFSRWCLSQARRHRCAVLVIAHEGQSQRSNADAGTAAARGATALPSACRWVARIRRMSRSEGHDRGLDVESGKQDSWLEFQLTKRNYHPGGPTRWWLRWQSDGFPGVEDPPEIQQPGSGRGRRSRSPDRRPMDIAGAAADATAPPAWL